VIIKNAHLKLANNDVVLAAAGLRLIAFNLKMKSLELELGTFNSSQ